MVKEYNVPSHKKPKLTGKQLIIANLEWKIKFHEKKIEEAKQQINRLKGDDNYG